MTDTIATPEPLTLTARIDQMFPTLTPAQMERIAVHGQRRPVRHGEVLFEAGAEIVPFFVVAAGQIEIAQRPGRPKHSSRSMARDSLPARCRYPDDVFAEY